MKSSIFALFFTILASVATAQNYRVSPIGDVQNTDGSHTYFVPRTTVSITLTIQHDSFHAGAYARYAQRFFNTPAILADRESYTVVRALISDQPAVNQPVTSDIIPLPTAPVNITEQQNGVSLEMAATDAAKMVYNLRKRRVELISGDVGEHIYGEGLRAALDEFDRLEQSYLALFYGTQTSDIQTFSYSITPIAEQMRYIICNLSQLLGVRAANATGGDPVTVVLTPSAIPADLYPPQNRKDKRVFLPFQVADNVAFTLMVGEKEITTATLPVYQLGIRVMIAQ